MRLAQMHQALRLALVVARYSSSALQAEHAKPMIEQRTTLIGRAHLVLQCTPMHLCDYHSVLGNKCKMVGAHQQMAVKSLQRMHYTIQ